MGHSLGALVASLVADRLSPRTTVYIDPAFAFPRGPLGIVYKTDAMAEPAVKVVATFPAASHPAIVYPVGRVATSENASAADFISYLQGAKAQSIFKAQGFTVLVPPAK